MTLVGIFRSQKSIFFVVNFIHSMSYNKINHVNQYQQNHQQPFDLKEFNKSFEDLTLLSRIKMSDEDIIYKLPMEQQIGCYKDVPGSIIDSQLSNG